MNHRVASNHIQLNEEKQIKEFLRIKWWPLSFKTYPSYLYILVFMFTSEVFVQSRRKLITEPFSLHASLFSFFSFR